MSDVFGAAQRSDVMRRVRSSGTALEKRVLELARAAGARLRTNSKDLPGAPDVVAPAAKVAVFAHGCFWHQHSCSRGSRRPASNAEYWTRKLERNVRRDRRVARELRALGWTVVTVWECQLKTPERVQRRLVRYLSAPPNTKPSSKPRRAANDR
jgi:DNA mismatch endonuclease (patch repair protein)